MAVLGAGALDRLPLALAGSLPSLGVVIFQSIKNLKTGCEFRQTAEEGPENHEAANRCGIGRETRRSITRKRFTLVATDSLLEKLGLPGRVHVARAEPDSSWGLDARERVDRSSPSLKRA